jgi:3-hydroxy-9,10-secoandrosta-1,3,5(10)-triene-9,17-dione monooxygenase
MAQASPIPAPEHNMTPELMLQRASEMIPTLRDRAAKAERLRTLPVESIDDFLNAGFYRILQPRRFGGYELGLRCFCDVMINITRGCGSSGWVLCLTSAHTFHMAACVEEGQIEMYGDDGDFRSPLILAPQGTAVEVEGGYRLNGRWNYNSGGEHANWVAVSAIVPGESEQGPPKDLILAFIRREEYEIFDNWHVLGMRGTGSKQAVIENVLVPHRRVISQPAWGAGNAPGFGVHENPFYRTPHMDVFCAEVGSVCIGLAEAAMDAFYDRAITKTSPFPPFAHLKNEHAAQRRIGLARARVDAASAILDRIINNQSEYAEQARNGTLEFSKQATTRTMMRVQQIARLAAEAVDLLFESSGTSATQSGQPMERIYRDLSMVRTHYIMDADRSAENWGAIHFGLAEHSAY